MAVRVSFFGTPEFAAVALEALIASGHEVVGVVCQPDKPAGRGQHVVAPPVKVVALAAGLPLAQPRSVRSPETLATLAAWGADVAVVAAYGKILPPALLHLPRHGCINIHASLLPRYRGAAPIQWAIARGEEQSGVTIMQMDEGMDTGPILLQRPTPIAPDETGRSLHDRLAQLGADLVLEALSAIESGRLVATPQNDSLATTAPPLRKEDGRIDWRRPAIEIGRMVRAFDPWPTAFTTFGGKRLRIWRARLGAQEAAQAPGTVIGVGDAISVTTGMGTLDCLELQFEGRRRLTARDFSRGADLACGSRLG